MIDYQEIRRTNTGPKRSKYPFSCLFVYHIQQSEIIYTLHLPPKYSHRPRKAVKLFSANKKVSFSPSTPLVSARRGAPLFEAVSSRPNSKSLNNSAFGSEAARKPLSLSVSCLRTHLNTHTHTKWRRYDGLTGVFCCVAFKCWTLTLTCGVRTRALFASCVMHLSRCGGFAAEQSSGFLYAWPSSLLTATVICVRRVRILT